MQGAELGETRLVTKGHKGQGQTGDEQGHGESDHAGAKDGEAVLSMEQLLHRLHGWLLQETAAMVEMSGSERQRCTRQTKVQGLQ